MIKKGLKLHIFCGELSKFPTASANMTNGVFTPTPFQKTSVRRCLYACNACAKIAVNCND